MEVVEMVFCVVIHCGVKGVYSHFLKPSYVFQHTRNIGRFGYETRKHLSLHNEYIVQIQILNDHTENLD